MKKATFLFLWFISLALTGQSLQIVDYTQKVSFGFRSKTHRKIDMIVIHSSYNKEPDSFSVAGILHEYQCYHVAAHYLIDRQGIVYRLVPETDVAFHAGKSRLPGTNRTNLNATSIGIELINTPSTPPDQLQYQSLVTLIQDIKKRYSITHIVGHQDIAPLRKTDPWLFDWKKFGEMMKAQSKQ